MHVEFRCSEVRQACAFDPQSFYRVKQQLHRDSLPHLSESTAPTAPIVPLECLSLYHRKKKAVLAGGGVTVSAAQIEEERRYTPVLRVELVLEQLIRLHSSDRPATREGRQQRGACREADFATCVIRTRTFSLTLWEVLLATLPMRALDGAVKIRLLQFPPPLRTRRAQEAVQEALGSATAFAHQMGTPLCIGVGKITLKELLSIRGGVRMSLQAKKGIVNAVESLNLSTTATNTMLGRDVGGSAFITLEVTAFSYGKTSLSKLLFFPTTQPNPSRSSRGLSPSAASAHHHLADEDGERSTISMSSTGVYESPVTRFFFIPYIAAVDVLLRAHDVLSWREPLQTVLVIAIMAVAVGAEVLPLLVLVLVLGLLVRFATSASRLYRLPLHTCRETTPRQSTRSSVPSSPFSTLAPYTYIFGRQNKLLNALVRSQLFYAYGLQEESFYEIAFVFHLLRRRRNTIISVAMACVVLLLVPLELSFLAVFLGLFGVYPVILRFHIPRSAKQRRRRLLSLTYLLNSWRLNHPLKVSRIVHVSSGGLNQESSSRAYEPELNSVERGLSSRRNSSSARHAISHARYASLSFSANLPSGQSTVTKRQQAQNATKLSFVVLSLTSLSTGTGESTQLLPLLRAHWHRTHLLHQRALEVSQPGKPGLVAGRQNTSLHSSSDGYDAMYAAYVKETVQLLSHIRSKTFLQAYVTPTAQMPTVSDSLARMDSLVKPNWLLDLGEDDGITSTVLAMPHYAFMVAPLAQQVGASTEAQALAALAAYLLQGARLSIYSRGRANRNCCVILPLQVGSSRFERYPPLHSKHRLTLGNLINALQEIWQNAPQQMNHSGRGAPSLTVSQDMVLQIVKTHSDLLVENEEGRPGVGRPHSFAREPSQLFPIVSGAFDELSAAGSAYPRRNPTSSTYPQSLYHVRTPSCTSQKTMPAVQSPLRPHSTFAGNRR